MSASKFAVTPIRMAIHREGDSPLFGETATWVETEDEGGGPYLRISQPARDPDPGGQGGVTLTAEELPLLLEAARLLGLSV